MCWVVIGDTTPIDTDAGGGEMNIIGTLPVESLKFLHLHFSIRADVSGGFLEVAMEFHPVQY